MTLCSNRIHGATFPAHRYTARLARGGRRTLAVAGHVIMSVIRSAQERARAGEIHRRRSRPSSSPNWRRQRPPPRPRFSTQPESSHTNLGRAPPRRLRWRR